jgi:hypothetical protein
MIPIAKPKAALLVNRMPRFVNKRDDAVGLLVIVFTAVDKKP